MIEAEWINLLGNVGLPATMVLWFMFRTEKVITTNTEALIKVTSTIEECKRHK